MFRISPILSRGEIEPEVKFYVKGGVTYHYCDTKISLIHTPHSTRASFITSRSGLLPVEIIADLVGHNNRATTIYYTVESVADIERRVIEAANEIWQPDLSNPVHIRADRVNSRLRESFGRDRSKTELAFGFRTLGLLADDRPDGDGIALLRSSPMAQIVFRETHICPVGEACPTDVIDNIVEPRRCGVCPLAVKSVDHLPAIGAKMRHLLEQLQQSGDLLALMRLRGEPVATLQEITDRRRLDIAEYEGWKAAVHSLMEALEQLEETDPKQLQVGMPEAVERHLRMVSRDAEASEFILARLVDSRTYSAFETPLIRSQAAQLRQRLLSSGRAIAQEAERLVNDPVASALAGIRVMLEARGLRGCYDAALSAIKEQRLLIGANATAGRI
jgi:hypothetical protein